MGIAVLVPGVNWASKNLGQVTPQGDVPIQAISVVGNDSIIGNGQYVAQLFPSFTTQRGVTWSIVSGSNYASITQDGIVSALAGASGSSVTIRATSTADSSIYGQKTISVTAGTIVYYDYMESDGNFYFLLDGGSSFGDTFPAHKIISRHTYTTGNGYIFGGRYWSSAAGTKTGTYKRNAGDIGVALGALDYVATGVTPVVGKIYRLVLEYSSSNPGGEASLDAKATLYDDVTGTQIWVSGNTRNYLDSDISLFCYGYNEAGAGTPFTPGSDTFSTNRLYGFEVYDLSDNKIMDIKAATLDGTPILMDVVANKIYYKIGSGTPTVGND